MKTQNTTNFQYSESTATHFEEEPQSFLEKITERIRYFLDNAE